MQRKRQPPQRRALDLGPDVVGVDLRADVGCDRQFLDLDLAAWCYRDMGHARGPACGRPFL